MFKIYNVIGNKPPATFFCYSVAGKHGLSVHLPQLPLEITSVEVKGDDQLAKETSLVAGKVDESDNGLKLVKNLKKACTFKVTWKATVSKKAAKQAAEEEGQAAVILRGVLSKLNLPQVIRGVCTVQVKTSN